MNRREEVRAAIEAMGHQPHVVLPEPSATLGIENTVEVRGIYLKREGDDIVVLAWMPDNTYREVIRERAEGPISHCVHANGIKRARTV